MTTAAPIQATLAHNLSQSARTEANAKETTSSSYIPRGDTTVTLNYFRPPEDGSIPFNYVEDPPAGEPQRNFGDFDIRVPIKDIRGHEDEYTLDRDAFKVVSHLAASAEKEFANDDSIKKNYYPEVEQLILDHVPGSNRVVIFDHTIRRSTPNAPRGPVSRVHIDQTLKSATQRVHQHVPSDAETLLKGRYRIINIWRPLNGPVQSNPLGFASSSSLKDEDLIPVEHRYPERTGETAGIRNAIEIKIAAVAFFIVVRARATDHVEFGRCVVRVEGRGLVGGFAFADGFLDCENGWEFWDLAGESLEVSGEVHVVEGVDSEA
ncbi:hypothetical protein M7I_3858 [Glarea lozoyensis 74030]|uniref:Uncharacterized protein n=1 Tax=Glarea lozoyensis (strain ATCC 74030 / MF5533) TaxID=1104152 RepID=H0EML9_GLAL7|nr:hypothetical protein M7I_3858 [Glarea lozoyensis 74030]